MSTRLFVKVIIGLVLIGLVGIPVYAKERLISKPDQKVSEVMSFQDITNGIMAARSSIRSMKASYSITYRDTNWGQMTGEDGRWIRKDALAGEYDWAIADIKAGSQAKQYVAMPLNPEGGRWTTAFNGKYATELTVSADGKRRRGKILPNMPRLSVIISEAMQGLTYRVLYDTWEHALGTGSFELKCSEAIRGHNCYVLEGRVNVLPEREFAGYPTKAWIDPGRGFAVVRLEVYTSRTAKFDAMNSFDVLEMKEVSEGLWVPVHVLYRHGKEIVVKEISVNEKIPEKLFTIKFPRGTKVSDSR